MSDELGPNAIGKFAGLWQKTFSGRMFYSKGSIVNYRKRGGKKGRGEYLIHFPGTKNQPNGFRMWCFKNDFDIIDQDATPKSDTGE